ncbi:small G protein signaling modulator 1-like isoform X2 [Pantherophis guttatus]|uniref:Small G protein signaling modulator 1 isoform X2 n=1 Tax=Pantherophis guttatus TaxID=94885 RepID=A0A6P9CK61_PANGU|nr:small G protein signaling modulator 1 isoform X2 [Pantherophis guttatus]XP_060547965.1 small G protein signaling modulator 1-like isoform X2 [Pantherophis guttatus]
MAAAPAAPAPGSGRRAPGTTSGSSSALRALAPASLLLLPAEAETRQRLLRTAKKEVKQIMEEAVTRKFVHEDSSHIISFCAAVEACVLHGLKRRAAGFLRSNKMAALFMKVGKSFPPAEELSRKVQDLEQLIESTRNQGSNLQESARKAPKPPSLSPQAVKHLWIRTALFEKVLDKIVHYLVENSSKYYEKEALLMDPVDGPILASLLVGPCALEYTKMKTADHFWTDPSADELVQRHRIHSSHCRQDSPTKRPALCIQKRHSSGSMDDRPSLSARDYVESLHQNSRATLLYGKNNVLVQPRDDMEAIPGYLSLHQTADVMALKWTPNQLMNGSVGDLDYEKSVYWDYAMTIHLEEIVYLHCHQHDSGGTVVLVSQDGIQRPPLRFPKGGHLLQFLSCLENGLLPHGQLDPPLWSQRGKGKVFPRLKKRNLQGPPESSSDREEEEATDYVFRILYPGIQDFAAQDLMDAPGSALPSMWQPSARKASCSSCTQGASSENGLSNGCNHERAPLRLLCDNMKYQIVSRAFYGWLAYCRHLSTVRTHLSALVNHAIVSPEVPCNASSGLTAEIWERFLQDGTRYEEKELLRLVYFGGIQHEIRKSVWPFLLGHYQFGMLEAERKEVDLQTRAHYEQTMAEWLGCEAIVRQREKESHAAALAKCSSAASLDSHVGPLRHRDSTVSNGSSQSSSFGPQNLSRLQSDSSGSTQVFESVEELEQTETEMKLEAGRRAALPNEGVPEAGSCSPDSGHPSSQNFSVASAYSEQSFSTEESWPEGGKGGAAQTSGEGPPPAMESTPLDGKGEAEGPQGEVSAARALDAFIGIGQELPGKEEGALSVADRWALPSAEQPNSMGSEDDLSEEPEMESLYPTLEPHSLAVTDLTLSEVSPVSSSGVTYSPELLDLYTVNLHRIEKDVQRCDRNYWYFSPANLEKLRNIMCSYIWHHIDVGYVQGMCDLLAPLLVILDEEALAFSCFTELMKRMNQNFPHGGAMDSHFANMRSLIQILDSELFELMHQNGDYTHFYFCYRWFLLDFKRELVYEDVFTVWETIWAAGQVSSPCYGLFIALALVEVYRDIILENNMDFTDIIKFFNEMAERHNTKQILQLARELVSKVQTLIENK